MQLSLFKTLQNAEKLVELFRHQVREVPYEEKGMLFSEVFFVRAVSGDFQPKQVLESGRARAQSTCTLGLVFPESRVVSVERSEDSADVPLAEERLSGRNNVFPLYGDSELVLPTLVRADDLVVIDGPKRFRAVRLALRTLQTGKPLAVFIHDCYKGLPERRFLEKYLPETFYSDNEKFVENYKSLDNVCWSTIDELGVDSWGPYKFDGKDQESYGPTLACIPFSSERNYGYLALVLRMLELFSRFSGR